MNECRVDDTADYPLAASAIYAEFRAMPNSTSVADDANARTAVMRALGGRSGMRIADLGCGPGVRTREMATLPQVALVVGVDHSVDQLARARAAGGPDTCRFFLGDLLGLGRGDDDWAAGDSDLARQLGSFDLALMAFVTSHAATQYELDAMLRAAASFLKPGGHLVVLDAHPRLNRAPFPQSEQYAVRKTFVLPNDHSGQVPAFTMIRTTFLTPKGELTVEDYSHDVASWASAVEAAGLGGLTIEDFSAPPCPDPDFWNDYITPDHPSGCSQAAVIRAVKPRDGRIGGGAVVGAPGATHSRDSESAPE